MSSVFGDTRVRSACRLGWVEIFRHVVGWVRSWVSVGRLQKIKLFTQCFISFRIINVICGRHYLVLKVITSMPVTSLLVLFGHGLDWIVGPNFSCDGLGQTVGWIGLGQKRTHGQLCSV